MADIMVRPPVGRCGDCRFWARLNDSERGRCRRYPPQVVATETREAWVVRTDYPQTVAREGCGEFAPREP